MSKFIDVNQYLKNLNQNLDEFRTRQPEVHTTRLVDNDLKSAAPADFQPPFTVKNFNGNLNPPQLVATAGVGIRLAKVGTSSGIACEISFTGNDNWFPLLPGSEIRVPFNSFVVRSIFSDASMLSSTSQIRLIIYHREDAFFYEPDSSDTRTQEYSGGSLVDSASKMWRSAQQYNSLLNVPPGQFDPSAALNSEGYNSTGFVLDGVKSLRIMLTTNGAPTAGETRLWYYDGDVGGTDWFENQNTILSP